MLLPQRDDLLFDRGIGAARPLGRHRGELLQRSVAALLEAPFPIVDGPATNMGGATGQGDIATRRQVSNSNRRCWAVVSGKWMRLVMLQDHSIVP